MKPIGMALIAVLVLLAGCTGERTPVTPRSRVAVQVTWPASGRLIPAAAASLLVVVRAGDYDARRVLARPDGGGTTNAVFEAVPVGSVTVTVTAHPAADGTGTAQARAVTTVETRAGQVTPVNLTLQSTIARIDVNPATTTLLLDETVTCTATPRDAGGNLVLIAPGNLQWSSANPAVATVDAAGQVRALSEGATQITATERESGINGAAQLTVRKPVPPATGTLIFLSMRDGNAEIYAMNPDGSNQRRLTNTASTEDEISISRDGRTIAFINNEVGRYQIYSMNVDGGNVRRLTTIGNNDWGPRFSPDGGTIAFFRSQSTDEIYLMNANGSNQRRITENNYHDTLPVFTPDGAQLVVASMPNGNYDLFIMNPDGSNVRQLTRNGSNDWYHDVSPDGRTIVFTSGSQLRCINTDGANERPLTTPAGYADGYPCWSPDGTRIAFASNRDGQWDIYVMNADGSNPQRLTNTPAREWHPAWGP